MNLATHNNDAKMMQASVARSQPHGFVPFLCVYTVSQILSCHNGTWEISFTSCVQTFTSAVSV